MPGSTTPRCSRQPSRAAEGIRGADDG
jgi:hypothetical protein